METTETITEVRAVFTHLPTGTSWETPWLDESEGISGASLTQSLEDFFQSDREVFIFDRGVYFSITRIILQQCSVVREFRTIEGAPVEESSSGN